MAAELDQNYKEFEKGERQGGHDGCFEENASDDPPTEHGKPRKEASVAALVRLR